jgi:hypothetical protein
MTTYKGIKGLSIREIAGDPDPLADGDIWYSSVTAKIRGAKTGAGAWASGGNLNTARRTPGGTGNGTQGAFSIFGGYHHPTPSPSVYSTAQEQYDGSSWTEAGDLNMGRYEPKCGAGTQTAALMAGGVGTPGERVANSEEWDASTWAEGPDLNTDAAASASAGTQTAALGIAGSDYPTLEDAVESYNGSSWSEIADINSGRYYVKGNGTQTAALISGGASFPTDGTHHAKVESWDGSSWTETTEMNTTRTYDLAAFGTSTSAIHAGGAVTTNLANSEEWDGSSWTEVGDLATAIRYTVGGGTTSAGIQASGYTSADSNVTQEWTQASAAVTFTSS